MRLYGATCITFDTPIFYANHQPNIDVILRFIYVYEIMRLSILCQFKIHKPEIASWILFSFLFTFNLFEWVNLFHD